MDLIDLPFNMPVILRAEKSLQVLQCTLGTYHATAVLNRNDEFVWVELVRDQENNISIRAARDAQYLVVHPGGLCGFHATTIDVAQSFDMVPLDNGSFVFMGVNAFVKTFLAISTDGRVKIATDPCEWEVLSPACNYSYELQTVTKHLDVIQQSLKEVQDLMWDLKYE